MCINHRYSRVANSPECFASLKLNSAASDNFKNIGHKSLPIDESEEGAAVSQSKNGEDFHALLIFPDDKNLLSFDLAVICPTCVCMYVCCIQESYSEPYFAVNYYR